MLSTMTGFIKLFHLFFLFIWIGTLLSLTRLLATRARDSVESLKKLYLTTDLPAMCMTIVLGWLSFFAKEMNFKGGWLHMKLTFVILLIVVDIFTGRSLFKKELRKRGFFIFLHILVLLFLLLILFSICLLKK